MSLKKEIVVRFVLRKSGDGAFPNVKEFSPDELADLRRTIDFNLCWEPDLPDEPIDAQIEEVKFLYDVISRFEMDGVESGIFIKGKKFICQPCPIVRFKLSEAVDPDAFVQAMQYSYIAVSSQSRRDNDEESYMAEDQQGYTEVLLRKDVDSYVAALKKADMLANKSFSFPDGIEDSHVFEATDFAVAPK